MNCWEYVIVAHKYQKDDIVMLWGSESKDEDERSYKRKIKNYIHIYKARIGRLRTWKMQ